MFRKIVVALKENPRAGDIERYKRKFEHHFNETRRSQGSLFRKEGNVLTSKSFHSAARVAPTKGDQKSKIDNQKEAITTKRQRKSAVCNDKTP